MIRLEIDGGRLACIHLRSCVSTPLTAQIVAFVRSGLDSGFQLHALFQGAEIRAVNGRVLRKEPLADKIGGVARSLDQVHKAVDAIAASSDLLEGATEQALSQANFIAALTAAEHVAIFNSILPGLERIYLAILYLEVTKRTRDLDLEVLTLFLLLHFSDAITTVEQVETFKESLFVYGPGFRKRFQSLRGDAHAIALLRRHRLEHLHAAHEWLLGYIDVTRGSVRSIASVFQPVLDETLRNDAEHAKSRADVARIAPDVVAAVDRFADGMRGTLEHFFTRADALRHYLQMQALTEAAAIEVVTREDDASFEQRVVHLLTRGKPREAWEALQRFRSTVLRSQMLVERAEDDPTSESVAEADTNAWAKRFKDAEDVADPVQRFAERIRLEALNARSPTSVGIEGLFEQLVSSRDASAIVEYVLAETEAFAIVLREGALAPMVVRIPLARDKVRAAARALLYGPSRFRPGIFEQGWRIGTSSDLGLEALEALTPLVRWIPDLLSDCRHVCLVPYGELHALPLHAVPIEGGAHRRYLIETHSVSYVPSAGLLSMTHTRRTDARTGQRALVAGAMFAHQNNADLDAHLERVAALFEPTDRVCLRSQEATPSAIKRFSAEGFWDLVYLHGHGRFDADAPSESCILLGDGQTLPTVDSGQEGHALRAGDIAASDLSGDMCVLASCLSGRTKVHSGDEVLGLVRSLFVRGFRSAITALWSFEVASARTLLEEFLVQKFSATVPTGAAFAAVQRRMLHGEFGERWRHPYFWGAFVLLGDWR